MNYWTRRFCFRVLVVLASLCHVGATLGCESRGVFRSAKSQIVSLEETSVTSAFYLMGKKDDVMLFQSGDVIAALRRRIDELHGQSLDSAATHVKGLLDVVEADLPLTAHTDLFKYALIGDYGRDVDLVVADLLNRGHAYVNTWFSFQKGLPSLKQIKILSSRTKRGTLVAQAFCTTENDDLLTVVYIVE